ncbi:MAG TPA: ABC transporter substrate-binding protein [Stellaceae bacterium]|nr:ABC transporter substrate-binding protein [Stellaceae bacterium]
MTLTRNTLSAAVALAALALAHPAAAADSLTVVSWGGAYQTSQQKAYFQPFAASAGLKVQEEEYNGEIAKIRAMVQSGNVSWDVVDVDTQTALQACEEGLIEKLDWSKIGDQSKFIEGTTTDCAVGTIVYSTIYAYDTDKMKTPPTSIGDLFDTAKFPGKRGLQKSPFVNLEFALLADGVAPKDVYPMLKTPAGVDRAFKKLDTIKKDVVWWEAGAQPAQLLASGEVVMSTAWNGRIFDAAKNQGKHFKIVWDGQVPDYDFWVIPKGGKKTDLAYKFIAYASDPKVMANQSKYISYGPTNVDALPNIAPDVLTDLPTAPANTKTALVQDYFFWGDHGEELRKRFNTWLAQ